MEALRNWRRYHGEHYLCWIGCHDYRWLDLWSKDGKETTIYACVNCNKIYDTH